MTKIKNNYKKATDDNSGIVRRNESVLIRIKRKKKTLKDFEREAVIMSELIESQKQLIELLKRILEHKSNLRFQKY